jgi:hypothetical protein
MGCTADERKARPERGWYRFSSVSLSGHAVAEELGERRESVDAVPTEVLVHVID